MCMIWFWYPLLTTCTFVHRRSATVLDYAPTSSFSEFSPHSYLGTDSISSLPCQHHPYSLFFCFPLSSQIRPKYSTCAPILQNYITFAISLPLLFFFFTQ
ncbi:hypothetical protein GYMLUDRAFT_718579 [Collybiopsis luxurians FD-317 M1]|nr:hypothetical protein GYMLUDRAFT_718579 [Collybiopsis luxurians FD-317 M1]